MSWVLDLVENLPAFMTYVVPGYLFLAIYRYVLFKDENVPARTAHTLLNSVAVSFVLKTLYDGFACQAFGAALNIGGTRYLAGIFIVSVFAGYGSAKAAAAPRVREVLEEIDIHRTIHENIWDDILETGTWLRIWLRDSGRSYYGQVRFIENYGREPLVVLERYQFLGDDAEVLFDNTEDPKRTVLLNLSQFKRVEIVKE